MQAHAFQPLVVSDTSKPFSVTSEHYVTRNPTTNRSPDPVLKSCLKKPFSTLPPPTKMPRERRSLQSILVPSFLHNPPPSAPTFPPKLRSASVTTASQFFHRATATSPINELFGSIIPLSCSPPPDFLLDDDPFANLSAAPTVTSPVRPTHRPRPSMRQPSRSESTTPTPRSPLSPRLSEGSCSSSSFNLSPPQNTFTLTPGAPAIPAHKKPAFISRSSEPSLQVLSTNVIMPKKVRQGRVGAQLPSEPWDIEPGSSASPNSEITLELRPKTSRDAPDFTTGLDPELVNTFTGEFNVLPQPGKFPSNYDHDELYDASSSLLASPPSPDTTSDESTHSNNDPLYLPSSTRTFSSDSFLEPLSRSESSSSLSSLEDADLFQFPEFSTIKRRDRLLRRPSVPPFGDVSHFQNLSSSSADSDPDQLISTPENDFNELPNFTSFAAHFSSSSEEHSESEEVGWKDSNTLRFCNTPHTSFLYEDEDQVFEDDADLNYRPGSSAGTIRGTLHSWSSVRRLRLLPEGWMSTNDDMADSTGYDQTNGRSSDQRAFPLRQGGGRRGQNGGDGGGHGGSGRGGASGSGAGDDEGDRGRRSNGQQKSMFSTSDSDPSTSGDESDDYSASSARLRNPVDVRLTESEDDVPLAQRLPNALTAQRTIRKQVRDERDQRRQERATLREQGRPPRERSTTLRIVGSTALQPTIRNTHDAATVRAPRVSERQRTKTLPGEARLPFAFEDLTKKLMNVQIGHSGDGPSRTRNPEATDTGRPISDHHSQAVSGDSHQTASNGAHEGNARGLRPFRSTAPGSPEDFQRFLPEQRLGRSVTTVGTRPHRRDLPQGAKIAKPHSLPIRGIGEVDERSHAISNPATVVGQPAEGDRKSSHKSPKLSHDVPASFALPAENTFQQRFFIGDMQRFNMIDVGPSTSAQDVIKALEDQGALSQWVGSGGWMIFELAQDFGMERPVRSYELISEVVDSWFKDKSVNAFLVRLTSLSNLLSRSAIPTSSPTHRGYVEWESKRGKWNKRFMELREHSLWLSKRDTGKDEQFLCSLSKFDAYIVKRLHKAPKPFVFAVKSTENMSLFESKADYLHVFSCGQQEGEKWLEKILLARSYVLQQERSVLFAKGSSPASGSANDSSPVTVARSGTRKAAPQPLLNMKPDVFEPGSLLASKRG